MDYKDLISTDFISSVASVAAALATFAGGAISFFAKTALKRRLGTPDEKVPEREIFVRLPELRVALGRHESIAKWNGRANTSLTFGQFVVGGVLASAFVQATLSSKTVGFLGVLVLVSSLVHQKYRPDLRKIGAQLRVVKLRAVIRGVEDALFAQVSGRPDAATIQEIREIASAGLAKIEEDELAESVQQTADPTAA